MARKRMIDPSFWVDEKLGTVEPRVRLLFMGLISQADDEGRLNGHPALVRSLIFAYDHDITVPDVDTWLGLLNDRNLIVRYEIDSQKYIHIINFKKHQTINRPQNSKLPEPFMEQSVQDHGTVRESADTNHAQAKLIEVNLKLSEVNIREGNTHAPDVDDIESLKTHLHNLVNQANLKSPYTLYDLDVLYSYIGTVDIEVIEAAIKKAFNKDHINYAINTLNGMIKEGKTKKEHLFPKPTPGQAPSNVTQFPRTGYSKKESLPIANVPDDLPEMTDEQLAEARKLAQTLDAAR